MDDETLKAAIEAQFLMGHCVPLVHVAMDRTTVTAWSWDVDQVRQQLQVPLNTMWEQYIFELEIKGLATFTFGVAPVTYDEQGHQHEIPGWHDQPRENWGSVSLYPRGVLRLADLYGRPYVRVDESPALVAHWHVVQAESEARLQTPYDQEQWAREWPEQTLLFHARLAQREASETDA
jgi:hypothetical protein